MKEKDEETVKWISCFGKLSHLCGICQELTSIVGKVDAPQPENLLGELFDVVERVTHLSCSLLSDTRRALKYMNVQQQVCEFSPTNFVPIDHDPGCRRKILTDEDRTYMIQHGPFQPKLGQYPRNSDIVPSKHCHFLQIVQLLSTPGIFHQDRCCILFCLPVICRWYWPTKG